MVVSMQKKEEAPPIRVKMIRGTRGEGGKDLLKGKTYEVSADFGNWLIWKGKAEPAPEKKKKAEGK